MPSTSHEALVLLFRNRPTLAAELLRDVFHVRLPEFREARIGSADFNEMKIAEYRADLLVELVDEEQSDGGDARVGGIVVEADGRGAIDSPGGDGPVRR